MSGLILSFLGSPRILRDGVSVELKRRKPLALLAYLAVTARTQSREILTELLYPGHPREQGYSNFRETLTVLRQGVGEKWLISDQGGVRLREGKDVWVDVTELRRVVQGARDKGKSGVSVGWEKALSHVATLVRGTFLAGFSLKDSPDFDDWQSEEGESLRRDEAWVLERLVDLHESREEYWEAVEPCRKWLSLDTFEEAAHRRLMRLYAVSGQRSLALRQYERCRVILEKELGAKPGEETEDLREQIAQGNLQPRKVPKAAVSPAASPLQSDPFLIPFVGRVAELERLKAAVEKARGGKGRMVMLVGEAGIGKTRLLEEATAHALADGVRVIWGRCYPDAGLPPLWPWRQALGQLVRESKQESVRKWTGTRGAVLGEILDELSEKIGALSAPARLEDPESERFRLAEAVAHLLDASAKEQPLSVVLDDLHCADSASLSLLEFVSRGLGDSRVLLLAASRSVESDPTHSLGRTLGELARERCFERMELSALGREQVAEMATRSGDAALTPGLTDALWERTRGNPLFVVESLRFRRMEDALDERSAETSRQEVPVPPNVRALIRRQLQAVSQSCYDLLETAAALGAEFTIETLSRVMKISGLKLLKAVDEAMRARFLYEQRIGNLGTLRFSHPLMQEAISEELTRSRRSELHAEIAVSLEELYGAEREDHAIELARHFALAQPLAPLDKLTRYSLLAGEQALAERASEEAVLHFQRGLAAKGSGTHDAETAWLRFGLARALPRQQDTTFKVEFSGVDNSAFAELTAAFAFFVGAGDVDSAARVAAHPIMLVTRRSGEWQTLADKGLEIVRPDSLDEARLLLLSAMVDEVRTGDYSVFCQRMERALSMARLHGDRLLELRIVSGWADCADISRKAADEMVRRAQVLIREVDDPMVEYPVLLRAYQVALSDGDITAAAGHAEAMLAIADRLRSDYHVKMAFLVKLELSWARGDWVGMRAASDQGLAVESHSWLFVHNLATRACLEFELGNVESGNWYLGRYLTDLKGRGFGHDLETCIAVQELAEIARLTGDRQVADMARAAASAVIAPGQEGTARGALLFILRRGLAIVTALQGDRETAGRLRPWYAEHHEDWIPGLDPTRPRLVGLLDLTLGNADDAVGEFEQALVDYSAQRPGPNVAWICSELAEALLARAKAGDAQRAAGLLKEGLAMATVLGMVPLRERYRQLAERIPASVLRRSRRGPVARNGG